MLKFDFESIKGLKVNPNVKRGDKIFTLESRNNLPKYSTLLVKSGSKIATGNFSVVSEDTSSGWTIYRGQNDTYIIATRDNMILVLEHMKNAIDSELDFLTKYKDEEEFVADKIQQLMQAGTIESKADILRLLKKSNYL